MRKMRTGQPRWALVSLLTLTTCFPVGCVLDAQELEGLYTVGGSSAGWLLSIGTDRDGTVSALLVEPGVGEHILTGSYEDGEATGRLTSSHRVGEFEIYYDEDVGHHFFVFVPVGPGGLLEPEREEEWPMVKGQGPGANAALARTVAAQGERAASVDPPHQFADVPRDPRLFGLWRSQVTILDGQGGFVQDHFLALRAHGTMLEQMGRGAAGLKEGAIESGAGDVERFEWRTQGDRLEARVADQPWVVLARFYIEGTSLLLTYQDGTRKLWTKVAAR